MRWRFDILFAHRRMRNNKNVINKALCTVYSLETNCKILFLADRSFCNENSIMSSLDSVAVSLAISSLPPRAHESDGSEKIRCCWNNKIEKFLTSNQSFCFVYWPRIASMRVYIYMYNIVINIDTYCIFIIFYDCYCCCDGNNELWRALILEMVEATTCMNDNSHIVLILLSPPPPLPKPLTLIL